MLHIKFLRGWPSLKVDDDGRMDDDGPLVYYKLTLWAFDSGELITKPRQFCGCQGAPGSICRFYTSQKKKHHVRFQNCLCNYLALKLGLVQKWYCLSQQNFWLISKSLAWAVSKDGYRVVYTCFAVIKILFISTNANSFKIKCQMFILLENSGLRKKTSEIYKGWSTNSRTFRIRW